MAANPVGWGRKTGSIKRRGPSGLEYVDFPNVQTTWIWWRRPLLVELESGYLLLTGGSETAGSFQLFTLVATLTKRRPILMSTVLWGNPAVNFT